MANTNEQTPPIATPPPVEEETTKSHIPATATASTAAPAAASTGGGEEADVKKWGTHIMGPPAPPTVHPDNQQAAQWKTQQPLQQEQPYLVYSPIQKPADNPLEHAVNMFNSWSHKAEDIARNIWHNLKTGPSVSGAAWGKVNLTAKAITEGGFESLFKQIFPTDPNEKLKKTFACYLSTSTGPVAGTMYLSTDRLAFCSDRPLSFKAPSGQDAWSYYKVTIPLGNIENVNPLTLKENEAYIEIGTVDGHEFWFMGFVNYEKASHHLLDSVSHFRSVGAGGGVDQHVNAEVTGVAAAAGGGHDPYVNAEVPGGAGATAGGGHDQHVNGGVSA